MGCQPAIRRYGNPAAGKPATDREGEKRRDRGLKVDVGESGPHAKVLSVGLGKKPWGLFGLSKVGVWARVGGRERGQARRRERGEGSLGAARLVLCGARWAQGVCTRDGRAHPSSEDLLRLAGGQP